MAATTRHRRPLPWVTTNRRDGVAVVTTPAATWYRAQCYGCDYEATWLAPDPATLQAVYAHVRDTGHEVEQLRIVRSLKVAR